jgi:GSCFA family
MTNPYRGLPSHHFWRSAVAAPVATEVDPIVAPGFVIGKKDRIATAGSCFAQHISRKLQESGYRYLVTERAPAHPGGAHENYGTFTARFGNIYSVRQLLQLLQRAYATFEPHDVFWTRADGRLIDPFRPNIQGDGFASVDELLADRAAHLAAVRRMFETCDVFVFTLGLTEAWESTVDGAVFPLAPGTVAEGEPDDACRFRNFTVSEMENDLARFIDDLRGVNPDVRVILTVSPVPLIATYEPRHVLVSTTYSKAALRVVAEQIVQRYADVDYFPSYEMITGPHTRGAFYAEDLREVLPTGVGYVMAHFAKHYLGETAAPVAGERVVERQPSQEAIDRQKAMIDQVSLVICDEELIERSL